MLTTDQLFIVNAKLIAGTTDRARVELFDIFNSERYQEWYSGMAQLEPFQARPSTGTSAILEFLGLVNDQGQLTVKINVMDKHTLFITDGVWVDPDYRVFPFCDESQILVDYVRLRNNPIDDTTVVDLASGCGHSAWAMAANAFGMQEWHQLRTVALDINPRALMYQTINKTLQGLGDHFNTCGLNDIRMGINHELVYPDTSQIIVMANMPFGPAPRTQDLPMTSNGGRSGLDLQLSTLEAIIRLRLTTNPFIKINAYIMGLSAGKHCDDIWDLHDQAVQLRQRAGLHDAKIEWNILTNEKLIRANGKRALNNPCSIHRALTSISQCQLYNPDPIARAEKYVHFDELAMEHERNGHPDLSYGILSVEM